MSSPNFHTNSYSSATVNHTNPYITLGRPVITRRKFRSKHYASNLVYRLILSHISQLFEQQLTFSAFQHSLSPSVIKLRRRSIDLSPKSLFWTWKQLFAIHFLLATGNVCPLAIPEFFAHSMVSDYWHCNMIIITIKVKNL